MKQILVRDMATERRFLEYHSSEVPLPRVCGGLKQRPLMPTIWPGVHEVPFVSFSLDYNLSLAVDHSSFITVLRSLFQIVLSVLLAACFSVVQWGFPLSDPEQALFTCLNHSFRRARLQKLTS